MFCFVEGMELMNFMYIESFISHVNTQIAGPTSAYLGFGSRRILRL